MTHYAPDTASRAPHWRDQAACLGQAALFIPDNVETIPNTGSGAVLLLAAKEYCRRCPVSAECLTDAMTTERGVDHQGRAGVRGGLTPLERAAKARRKRGVAEPQTLLDIYLARTEAADDGHVRWVTPTTTIRFHGRTYTSMQAAWACATNRAPEGLLRAECGIAGCVAAEHLSDAAMRKHASRLAAA